MGGKVISMDSQPYWMSKHDDQILTLLCEEGTAKPSSLESDLSLNRVEIFNRCQELATHGLVQDLADQRRHKITEAGKGYLEGEVDAANPGEGFKRLIDLSALTPEDFKFRNTKFLTSESRYDLREHERQADVRNAIWRVRNNDIRRALRRFPRDVSLIDQCAFWMRAFTGYHFFPDANHRTSIAILRNRLLNRNFDIGKWPTPRTQDAIWESKYHRLKKGSFYLLNALYKRDGHFYSWWFYFADVLPDNLKNKRYSEST